MFYYYGRKKQLARRYPVPACDTIIEPFAGSAAYSLHGLNWERNVILIERDPRVVDIWNWLIGASEREMRALPELRVGDRSSEFLHIVHAATKMAFAYKTIKVTPVLERNWDISRRVMADSLHKVRHWTVVQGDYRDAPDIKATWFIDPPYRGAAGRGYRYGSDTLDYEQLGAWAQSRQGQVIACEGAEGDYLPFEPLTTHLGVAGKRSQERIWHRPFSPCGTGTIRVRAA
ncbi:hypothetical protein [Curtobacterium sp. 24E2]